MGWDEVVDVLPSTSSMLESTARDMRGGTVASGRKSYSPLLYIVCASHCITLIDSW